MAGTTKTYVWKESKGLTLATIIVLAIGAAITACSLGVRLIFGSAATYDALATDISGPQALLAIIDLTRGLAIFAGVVILFWIYRASVNAHSFRPRMRRSPIGSIGWYIVPVLSLWVPLEAMSEIWDASSLPGAKRGSLLNWWWGLFLLSNVISVITRLGESVALNIASDLSNLSVSVIFIVIVRRLSAMQIIAHQTGVFSDPVDAPAPGSLEALIQ